MQERGQVGLLWQFEIEQTRHFQNGKSRAGPSNNMGLLSFCSQVACGDASLTLDKIPINLYSGVLTSRPDIYSGMHKSGVKELCTSCCCDAQEYPILGAFPPGHRSLLALTIREPHTF